MKVLLTGGSGFVAAHCLESLLKRSHSVVTTVRSHEKGQKILDVYRQLPTDQLSYVLVEDIAAQGAFDEAVRSDPPFEAVIHTASPFHFNTTNPEKDLLEPAINGTVGILKAIKANAPSVRKVVITSSMAAVLNFNAHPKVYTEDIWNPVTWEAATKDASTGYPGSKTFAEKAAWDFVEKEKPNFTLSTMNPPLIFGPVVHYLNTLERVNTSSITFRNIIRGDWKSGLPPTSSTPDWVDVRDVALAHVRAIERPEAAGKRFLIVAGKFSNAAIAEIVRDHFPQLRDRLPPDTKNDAPSDEYRVDTSRSKEVLGLEYRPLDQSVIDSINALLAISG